MHGFGFSKQDRLRTSVEYSSLSLRGSKIQARSFLIIVAANDLGRPRMGLTVSRKVGNAVVRNRVKRFLREFFRLHRSEFKDADYNVIARKSAAGLDYDGVCAELNRALQAPQA